MPNVSVAGGAAAVSPAVRKMEPPTWRKSSRSGTNGECLEVAEEADAVRVRDSKDPNGLILTFSTITWQDFIQAVRDGIFDRD